MTSGLDVEIGGSVRGFLISTQWCSPVAQHGNNGGNPSQNCVLNWSQTSTNLPVSFSILHIVSRHIPQILNVTNCQMTFIVFLSQNPNLVSLQNFLKQWVIVFEENFRGILLLLLSPFSHWVLWSSFFCQSVGWLYSFTGSVSHCTSLA